MLPLILVAEDEPMILELIAEVLGTKDYNLLLADNGTKALSLGLSMPITLVLSDIKMPQMTGIEMLTQLRQAKPHIPAILFSGTPEMAKAFKDDPLVSLLSKPLDYDALLVAVEAVLKPVRFAI